MWSRCSRRSSARRPRRTCCRCSRATSKPPMPTSPRSSARSASSPRRQSKMVSHVLRNGIENFTAYEARSPMSRRIIPLIMCGGAGTRLWPASREVRPKQFLPLFGKRSTFQETLLRVSDAALFERPIVITNAAYRFMVLEQLAEIGLEADILLEPVRRDSGPAIAAGAAFAEMRDGDAIVLALAADHVVQNTAAFIGACRQGLVAAASGHIVTFGVQPERA